jgi:hypothetical protein
MNGKDLMEKFCQMTKGRIVMIEGNNFEHVLTYRDEPSDVQNAWQEIFELAFDAGYDAAMRGEV